MMRISTIALLFVTGCMGLTAHGEMIRVSFSVISAEAFFNTNVSEVVMVFDTSTPGAPGPNGTLLFYPTSASLWATNGLGVNSPYVDYDLCELGTLESARLQYFPNDNTLHFLASDGADYGSLSITNMPAAFNPAMDSLPNDAANWAPNLATSEYNGSDSSPAGNVSWHPDSGFFGGTIFYSAIGIAPPSNACSPADLNEDGVVDFFDVSVFLQLFATGCP